MKLRIVQAVKPIIEDAEGFRVPLRIMVRAGLSLLFAFQMSTGLATADEVIINVHGTKTQSVGDFDLTPGAHFGFDLLLMPTPGLELLSDKNGSSNQVNQFTAGQLWSYYRSQGIQSLDHIVLYMDVGKLRQQESFSIESMEFRIVGDTDDITHRLMDRDQDNRVVIPGYETLKSMPVARMVIKLDFDFMERFTSNSTEMILVNMNYLSDSDVRPTFYVEGKRRWFSLPNMFLLTAFVVFWGVVFWILQKLTLKSEPIPQINRKPVRLGSDAKLVVKSGLSGDEASQSAQSAESAV